MRNVVAVKIRDSRNERGLTQTELGKVLGKTGQAISEIERGRVQIDSMSLLKLAEHLEKPIGYFYGEAEDSSLDKIILLIEKLPQELRTMQLPLIISLLEFQVKNSEFSRLNIDEDDVVEAYLRDFYSYLLRYLRALEKTRMEILQIKDEIETTVGMK